MSRLKVPPLSTGEVQGPNHILVMRRSSRASLRSRTRKLLASGQFEAVHVHGLGAALAPAALLAAELVQESAGRLVASCQTSTEALVDHEDPSTTEVPSSTVRHNSAIHIRLTHASRPTRATATTSAAVASGKKRPRS